LNKLIPYILFISIYFFTLNCSVKKDNQSQFLKGEQDLKILLADPVETLDPLKILYGSDWKVANNIFEGLVTLDENNQLKFDLTDTVSTSTDKLIYSFKLKDKIYFHDSPCFKNGIGRKLISSDINFMFERLATKSNNFHNWQNISDMIKGIEEFYLGEAKTISGITILDSLRFTIELTQPFSSFLTILTSPNFYLIPKEGLHYYKERFALYPVGTGPFRISEHQKFEKIILVRNENYHIKDNDGNILPYLNSIEYRSIEQTENRFSELVKNNIHLINASQTEYRQYLGDSLFSSQFENQIIDRRDGVRYWGFYFFDDVNELKYMQLRKLIAQSFDRSFLKKSIVQNKIAHTLLPQHHLGGYSLKWYEFDATKPGSNFIYGQIIDTIKIMANIIYKDLIEIENTLSELNIPFKRIIKPDSYYSAISEIKPTIFRVSMVPAFPDPIEYYSLFYSKNSSSINLGNFSNEKYDSLYEYVKTEHNDDFRLAAYEKLEKILKEETAALYLTHQGPINYIYSKKIKNICFTYMLPDFTKAYFN